VLSEPAALSLDLAATSRNLGRHAVKDYEGTHGFYSFEG
jgi:hypothetical protein